MNILVYIVSVISTTATAAGGDPSLLPTWWGVSSVIISTVNYGQQQSISPPKMMSHLIAYNNSRRIISSTQHRRELETVIDSSGQQINFSYDTTFSCPATVICHPVCVADVANCPMDAVCPDNYEVRLSIRCIFYHLLALHSILL